MAAVGRRAGRRCGAGTRAGCAVARWAGRRCGTATRAGGDGDHRGQRGRSGQRESLAAVVHGVLAFFLACARGRGRWLAGGWPDGRLARVSRPARPFGSGRAAARASGFAGTRTMRLDQDEWVALADGNNLGAPADQGRHEPQGVAGGPATIRSKPGASSWTMLPLCALASSASMASLAFTGVLRSFVAAAGLPPGAWRSGHPAAVLCQFWPGRIR